MNEQNKNNNHDDHALWIKAITSKEYRKKYDDLDLEMSLGSILLEAQPPDNFPGVFNQWGFLPAFLFIPLIFLFGYTNTIDSEPLFTGYFATLIYVCIIGIPIIVWMASAIPFWKYVTIPLSILLLFIAFSFYWQ